MVAYLSAVDQYSEGKSARNIEILARRTGLDEALLRKACWPSVRGDGRVDMGSMLEFQRWGPEEEVPGSRTYSGPALGFRLCRLRQPGAPMSTDARHPAR